ncbi:MAG TPA: PIN domain-containing protein [Polyangiaceae bacterium]|nr:PIN domain-containing protein [Polyangiaceae bacterium]
MSRCDARRTAASTCLPNGARLRVRHRLKSPDAVELATAVHAGCFAVVSRDRDFSRVKGVLILGMD